MSEPESKIGDPSLGLFDGRYTLLELLGQPGFYGEVWRATDATTGRVVALKLLDAARTTPDAAWREATALTSLESPHLLRVHGAALAVDVPYIDTELASGGTVSAAARPHGPPTADAIRWVRQAAVGLDLCHRSGLLHRDVKPANVFLNAQGDALLGDFGKAAIVDDRGTAACDGDPQIRAPEVLKGGRCTVASDIYSLGVTLHAVLVGRLPYRWEDFEDAGGFKGLRAAASVGPPSIRDVAPHVSRTLGTIVRKATALQQDDRYPTAASLARALAKLRLDRRNIVRVTPCAESERCWDAIPRRGNSPARIHVCVEPVGARRHRVRTRRTSDGARMLAHCKNTTAGSLAAHLRGVFDALR